MIRVHNLTHHYGVRPVLRDISLEVETGELVVLLGPNGMGKSTLLGCLAGVLWPHAGYVEIDGVRRRQSAREEYDLRRRCFYLPDDAWLPLARTGREFLIAVGRLYGVDYLRLFEHADRLLTLFHLVEQGDSPIQNYSTGQRKKIALASALIAETPYLLLDEPFSGGLDPAGIVALKGVLLGLRGDRGRTIVMTTPVPELVEELSDRVGVIRGGRLAAYDTVAGLKRLATHDQSFETTLQELVDPDTRSHIEQYFAPLPAGDDA